MSSKHVYIISNTNQSDTGSDVFICNSEEFIHTNISVNVFLNLAESVSGCINSSALF